MRWHVVGVADRMLRKWTLFIIGAIAALKLWPAVYMTLSMVVSILVYAVAFGIQFAIGFVLLLLAHEAGHWLAARLVGLRALPPVFIPFFGAVLQLEELPLNSKMEANVAIGGPAAGALSALLCLTVYFWTDQLLMLVLAYTACLINLFNMVPCEPLDGGRIAAAISPRTWWVGSLVIGGLFLYTYNLFLLIIFIFSLLRQRQNDNIHTEYYRLRLKQRFSLLWQYVAILLILASTTLYVSDKIR